MEHDEYKILDGKVRSNSLVLDIVKHCNLSCRGCGHLSPLFKKSSMALTELENDLTKLAQYYHTKEVLVLGGEPLLHPDIAGALRVIKDSGIGDKVKILTNGILLHDMPSEAWALVDEIRISIYPGKEIPESVILQAISQAETFGNDLSLQYYDQFRESVTERQNGNRGLVKRIFNTCLIAHTWHCNTIEDGHFYKCPQAYLIPTSNNDEGKLKARVDGIEIGDTPEFTEKLLAYLQSKTPLSACNNCLGTSGNLMPHEQVKRKEWRRFQDRPVEEMVDYSHLSRLEAGIVEDVPTRFIELVKNGTAQSGSLEFRPT